jgi:hypothetical protein
MRQDFVVYCHKRPTDGEIFYVGKGTAYRAKRSDSRNNYWNNIVEKHGGFDIEIVAENLTEVEALGFEVVLIKGLRDAGAKLCNLTDGGEGVSGFNHSLASRERMRTTNAGKTKRGHRLTEEHKKKLSLAKLGKPASKLNVVASAKGRWKAVVCVDTGIEYASVKEASKITGVNPDSISSVCRGKRQTAGNMRWKFVNATQQQELTS